MKKTKRIAVITFMCVLFLAAISIYAIPKLRVLLFVNVYHEMIEDGLKAGNGVPADNVVMFGYDTVNSWEASHPMTEFIIMSYGDTYYGCYYSPDDIPLAFQNTDTELIQSGHDSWKWNAKGDNHGETSKIMEFWYYFSTSF